MTGIATNVETLEAAAKIALEQTKVDGYSTHLIDVCQGDSLTEDQIVAYLEYNHPNDTHVDFDQMVNSDWEWEARWFGIRYEMEILMHGTGFTPDDLEEYLPEMYEELKERIEDADTSDVLKQLADGAGSKLFQIDLGCEMDCDLESGDREGIGSLLGELGVPAEDANVAAIESLIENQFDYVRELVLAVYMDVTEAGELQCHGGKITDPQLVVMDRWNGVCHEARIEGTFTVPAGRLALDSELGRGSIDKICGVSMSAFGADVEINETKIEEN